MKKATIEYYKKAVRLAENANDIISRARADYEHDCELTKNAYEADLLGEKGYQGRLKELETERDAKIENGLLQILTVVDEYDAEMAELGKLDGSMVDSGTMALLNSGLTLTSKDWQQLASKHRDNAVMTRILKERYDANRPQEEAPIAVCFGQSPDSRSEVFSKFVRTIYHACESGMRPSLSGGGRLKTVTDYYNFIAQDSLKDMQPFGEESFDNLDAEFPVETESGRVENAAGRSTSYSPVDFNFGFTPIK